MLNPKKFQCTERSAVSNRLSGIRSDRNIGIHEVCVRVCGPSGILDLAPLLLLCVVCLLAFPCGIVFSMPGPGPLGQPKIGIVVSLSLSRSVVVVVVVVII